MEYLYGPVPSRRLGFSLGVDLISPKICSFDCIYCQLGRTTRKTIRQFRFKALKKLQKELAEIIRVKKIDYVTISGSGEPTLCANIDEVIKVIRKTAKGIPLCVITNSSLLYRPQVRKKILLADLVIPSLDAACERTFIKINQPHKSLTLAKITEGLIKFRRQYKGKIWLEVMLVKGVNDSLEEAKKFRKLIYKIKPDKVQFNVPMRSPNARIKGPSLKRIKEIEKIINYPSEEEIKPFSAVKKNKVFALKSRDILDYLKRRPATVKDLSASFGLNRNEIVKILSNLLERKKIKHLQNKGYYGAI